MYKIAPDLLKDWQILIVDDEMDSLLVAKMLLQRCGAQVVGAYDGAQGFEKAKDIVPEFIISDLSMPNVNGWDMLGLIKDYPPTSHIPVIALTAHAMRGDRERAMAAGFHNYLTKPLMPQTFINDLLVLLEDVPNLGDSLKK